jgi:hypothetical protein
MVRILVRGVAAGCLALLGAFSIFQAGSTETSASSSASTATAPRTAAMRFELRRAGPAEVCGDACKTWVMAAGAVTPDTPRDFEAFARAHDIRGATIVLDSVGGSVVGALALGHSIRRLEMTTTVGRTALLPNADGEQRAMLSPDASCESMCAFVLLAGVQRHVPPEARVLVHQIWLGDRRDDAIAASYSAEDLMIVQRDIGRLAHFTVEMGGRIDLLDIALRIPPWEPMRALSQDEIRHMRLSTVDNPFVPAARLQSAEATEPSAPAVLPAGPEPSATTVALRASGISERGWASIEQGGRLFLARRHPMTAEGEDIGSFDLLFGCGDTHESFSVTYIDRRKTREHGRAAEMLRGVEVSLGKKSAALSLGRSQGWAATQSTGVATGTISAALLKSFAETGSRAMTVAARRANNAETVIRVGNSGFAKALPQLTAACSRQGVRSVRANLQ